MRETGEKPVVFVVDDEIVIAETLSLILHNEGYDTRPFTNPLEARRAARPGVPDLLITDVMMPQLSGIELAIQIREYYPKCRVLLFSGQAATSSLLQDARCNGHEFEMLTKPVHPRELLQKIEMLLELNGQAIRSSGPHLVSRPPQKCANEPTWSEQVEDGDSLRRRSPDEEEMIRHRR